MHTHHIKHGENGGPTELNNLVLLCPYHHRLHHTGGITITGPADRLVVTDSDQGPTGERAQWWWYRPFEPPPTLNGN